MKKARKARPQIFVVAIVRVEISFLLYMFIYFHKCLTSDLTKMGTSYASHSQILVHPIFTSQKMKFSEIQTDAHFKPNISTSLAKGHY